MAPRSSRTLSKRKKWNRQNNLKLILSKPISNREIFHGRNPIWTFFSNFLTENHPKFLPNHINLTYSHPASKVNSILNSKQYLKIRQKSYSKVTRQTELVTKSMSLTDFGDTLFWWQPWDLDDRFEMLVTNFFLSKSHLHIKKSRRHKLWWWQNYYVT